MPLSLEYIRLVLAEHFDAARTSLLDPLLAIHEAHLVMLVDTGIAGRDDARAIRAALAGLDRAAIRTAAFDGTAEDLFFHVDRLLADAAGPDRAGRLRTARSRNDTDMTMYRMRLREWLLEMIDAANGLRAVLLDIAAAHRETIFPAHTHGQPAQPTSLAHYALAVVEMLERDVLRLAAGYASTNLNPLGACAITGTGFAIDRGRTSELLGFAAPTGNTYGSIAAVDYLLESASAVSILLVGVGRVVQDLLLWSTREMGYLRLPDSLVQISSIMPQKRNPVPLEHARAIASSALVQLGGIVGVVHNTPFGDIVDTEDDLQPLIERALHEASRAVRLLALAAGAAAFDTELMRERAATGLVTVTELADALTRERGLSFTRAHEIVSRFVDASGKTTAAPAETLRAVAQALGVTLAVTEAELRAWLDPAHFVAVRRTPGGPAPDVTLAAIEQSHARLASDCARAANERQRLSHAEQLRAQALAQI
jgi:argininosuccinate lyase